MGGKYCHCTGKCLTLPMNKDEACLRPIVTPTSPVFFQNYKERRKSPAQKRRP